MGSIQFKEITVDENLMQVCFYFGKKKMIAECDSERMHEQDQLIYGFRNYSNKLQICYAMLEIFLKPKWQRRAASAFAQSIF